MELSNDYLPSQITIDNLNSEKQYIENTLASIKLPKESPQVSINLSLENNIIPKEL